MVLTVLKGVWMEIWMKMVKSRDWSAWNRAWVADGYSAFVWCYIVA
jgi:hypothetical protein